MAAGDIHLASTIWSWRAENEVLASRRVATDAATGSIFASETDPAVHGAVLGIIARSHRSHRSGSGRSRSRRRATSRGRDRLRAGAFAGGVSKTWTARTYGRHKLGRLSISPS